MSQELAPPADLQLLGAHIAELIVSSSLKRRNKRGLGKQPVRDEDAFKAGLRSELYLISEELVAPHARDADLEQLHKIAEFAPGETVVDVAAGTGFLSKYVAIKTKHGLTVAYDYSPAQLNILGRKILGHRIVPVEGSFSDEESLAKLRDENDNPLTGKVDVVTTLAAVHHYVEREPDAQKGLFGVVGQALRPGGRFVGADVGKGTSLSRFFDEVVTENCITSHVERWLSPERIEHDLVPGTGLEYVNAKVKDEHKMVFTDPDHMVLWAQSMLALDMSRDDIKAALGDILGFQESTDRTELNWPLLFWKVVKPDPAAAS